MDGNGNGNLPEARDRLDQPIINAIEVKNYKQALKLVDKRLAKKQSDDFLQVMCAIWYPHLSAMRNLDSTPLAPSFTRTDSNTYLGTVHHSNHMTGSTMLHPVSAPLPERATLSCHCPPEFG